MTRTAFFISDGTGITAESLGRSLLAQFENVEIRMLTKPYIDSVEKAKRLVEVIQATAVKDGNTPIIIDTIVDQDVRAVIRDAEGFQVDIFSTFLEPLEQELATHSSYSVGRTHAIGSDDVYMDRIQSVHFALDNDDGARTHQYDKADIILVGVSRCGKTPSSLYLALQFGIRAANYPLTEDDQDENGSLKLPPVLAKHRHKLFGLTIDPRRLAAIRHERRPNSRYSSMDQCVQEVAEAEALYRRMHIPYIDTTRFSVEEISTRMIAETGISRRFSPR
ncbi:MULTISPECIES: posphoenolpyruvate synthetase regulatory kinase/phosphorylase PpsR [Halomonas]|uniref:Putative phosphoenolpyruvate synthase regulatory protein n=2 Tax=Halomonas TaxID=2745 RepID=A0ABQ0U165_9GAMM|nr:MULTISPECIES: pyruvate, water dikinase regulatory protein [Halomonas]PSJ23649.1 kinase/pyrophosphorylase [Halomonas sp. ND22Bw]KGE77148.1 PEP synthetase regulatory protein [Halomonas salina]MDR5888248.1 pyruvate, water dikinase regulatory protein [Halomonas salina]RAH36780.1 kinase/pyrophosphorylase [Halomonas sp. SL1]WJY08764.1 pyruvate, water dikinase regulatory protein [Halomonas halophila]